jgi:ubiquitin-protein ligase
LGILSAWKNSYSIQTILEALLAEMSSPANRTTKQPAEGSNY